MKKQMLYRELAKYYESIYYLKDYKAEAYKIRKLILRYKKSLGKELLDVACGTGSHIVFLQKYFSCTGIDISKDMLKIAKKNVKKSDFRLGSMINFSLNKKFDVILCLFSSIGYVKTYSNLRKTINNFSRHLKKGGIVIIEPWFSMTEFKPGKPWMAAYDGKNIKIARLNVSKVKSNISILDLHYLVAENFKEVKYFRDRHELGMFGLHETLDIMKDAGLRAKFLPSGLMKERGLYIGIKK